MINEIKIIVRNYINNAKLCSYMSGSVNSEGIAINDKVTIPHELIRGNLKDQVNVGDKVRVLRNHGGKEYYILEIIDRPVLKKGTILTLSINETTYEYRVEDVNYDT
ncbi:MAG TPA: DNA helicase [Clostridiales bacterium]|nr:DNA helicase [Clostridiales bacterium]